MRPSNKKYLVKTKGGNMHKPTSKNPNLTKDTQEFIDKLAEQGGEPLYKMTPENARKFLENLQKEENENRDADVKDIQITLKNSKNINLRIFRPKNSPSELPAILYIHGGGWVLGSRNSWNRFLQQFAKCTNAEIIFPEYSLSPEAQYPKAINEIYEVLEYIHQNPSEFNINPDKIVIAGDSAGGNMAAVTAIKALKEKGPKIIFQLLFYPVTDADMDTDSYKEFADGPWLTKKAMEWFWDAYEPDKDKRKHPYISPLKADLEDLKGLPYTLIITDENDVLRDEGEAYARKLDEAGVKVMNVRINGTFHDFMVLNSLSHTAPVKAAFILACAKLKHVFEHQ